MYIDFSRPSKLDNYAAIPTHRDLFISGVFVMKKCCFHIAAPGFKVTVFIYEDSYFETRRYGYETGFPVYIFIYSGLECSNRSETIRNRKIGFLRIDVDVRKFF